MKKHTLKRDLALSILIACSLTGPIYAESVNVGNGETKKFLDPPCCCRKY